MSTKKKKDDKGGGGNGGGGNGALKNHATGSLSSSSSNKVKVPKPVVLPSMKKEHNGYDPKVNLIKGSGADGRDAKKKNAAANKLKYPKGAAQVVGVKEYLEDLAKKQTFFRDAAGNSRVGDTGHKWAKVKFGEFTKEAYDEWRAKGGKKLPNQMY